MTSKANDSIKHFYNLDQPNFMSLFSNSSYWKYENESITVLSLKSDYEHTNG